MTEDKKPDWIAIQGEYMAGNDPLRDIAERHGLTEGAIRKRARKAGWLRDPAKTKRRMVQAAMAGGTQAGTQTGTQNVLRTIEAAAAQDIADMERGIRIHRLCLVNLEAAAQKDCEPRVIKVIVEATGAAIESIRKIRSLDDSPADGRADEELAGDALIAELKRRGLPTALFEE